MSDDDVDDVDDDDDDTYINCEWKQSISISKSILFKLDSVRSGCPISWARGSCIKRSNIPDRIGI